MKKVCKFLFWGVLIILSATTYACSKSSQEDLDKEEDKPNSSIFPSGKVVCNGIGIADVVVSDGTYFTKTASDGTFTLPYNDKAKHVFISVPAKYTVPVEKSVAMFWKKLSTVPDKNKITFELIATGDDTKHQFVAVGDPQIRNNANEKQKLSIKCDQLAADIANLNSTLPVDVLVTGDVAFNDESIHAESRQCFAKLNQPVFYAIGNHDHQPTGKTDTNYDYDKTADAVFINNYGPTCYSFNRGLVHYIIYDNIYFKGGSSGADYDIKVTPEELKWIEKDLSYVNKNHAIIFVAHSPSQSRRSPKPTSYGNSASIHALAQGFAKVMHISGHTHYNSVCEANGVTEEIIGALCGAFWTNNECLDGSILGYKFFDVNGTEIKWKYVAAETAYKDKAFSYFTRNTSARPLADVALLVNVWDWDPKWHVEYSTDNGQSWSNMLQSQFSNSTSYDPQAFNEFGISSTDNLPSGRAWINATTTDHLFTADVESSIKSVIVRVTTRFNEVYTETISL